MQEHCRCERYDPQFENFYFLSLFSLPASCVNFVFLPLTLSQFIMRYILTLYVRACFCSNGFWLVYFSGGGTCCETHLCCKPQRILKLCSKCLDSFMLEKSLRLKNVRFIYEYVQYVIVKLSKCNHMKNITTPLQDSVNECFLLWGNC